MGIIVKLLGGSLGMASEAIHDYRGRSRSHSGRSPSPNSAVPTSSRPGPALDSDAPPEYVEVADEAAAEELVRRGQAEQIVGTTADDKKGRDAKAVEAGYGDEDDSSSSEDDSDVVEFDDEAAWELDDMAERVAPPSYADVEAASNSIHAEGESEEAKVKKEEQMIRDMVRMAGPPPHPIYRLPCSVIIVVSRGP